MRTGSQAVKIYAGRDNITAFGSAIPNNSMVAGGQNLVINK